MKSLTIIDYNFKAGTPQLQLSDPVIYKSIKARNGSLPELVSSINS